MKSFTFLCCSLFLLAGCSSKKTCRYEKEYVATADSLKKYPSPASVLAKVSGKSAIDDITKLSCVDYMEKYRLNDKELKIILETAEVTWSIGQTFQSIEENIRLADELLESREEESTFQSEDSTD